MSMDQIHKEHEIYASAFELPELPETQQWEPRVIVIWSEGSQVLDKYFPDFTKYFSTREEAERYGLTFARKWIDDGKLSLG